MVGKLRRDLGLSLVLSWRKACNPLGLQERTNEKESCWLKQRDLEVDFSLIREILL